MLNCSQDFKRAPIEYDQNVQWTTLVTCTIFICILCDLMPLYHSCSFFCSYKSTVMANQQWRLYIAHGLTFFFVYEVNQEMRYYTAEIVFLGFH
jgi:hypothetical protein